MPCYEADGAPADVSASAGSAESFTSIATEREPEGCDTHRPSASAMEIFSSGDASCMSAN